MNFDNVDRQNNHYANDDLQMIYNVYHQHLLKIELKLIIKRFFFFFILPVIGLLHAKHFLAKRRAKQSAQ